MNIQQEQNGKRLMSADSRISTSAYLLIFLFGLMATIQGCTSTRKSEPKPSWLDFAEDSSPQSLPLYCWIAEGETIRMIWHRNVDVSSIKMTIGYFDSGGVRRFETPMLVNSFGSRRDIAQFSLSALEHGSVWILVKEETEPSASMLNNLLSIEDRDLIGDSVGQFATYRHYCISGRAIFALAKSLDPPWTRTILRPDDRTKERVLPVKYEVFLNRWNFDTGLLTFPPGELQSDDGLGAFGFSEQ